MAKDDKLVRVHKSMAEKIDEFAKSLRSKSGLLSISKKDASKHLAKMIDLNRIDATINIRSDAHKKRKKDRKIHFEVQI